ncbi:MAG: hypothetical protein OSJ43_04065 [Oscillospiraceae bacterium]|nr:hypothetical protein [Oscillospiraceae bacterium]
MQQKLKAIKDWFKNLNSLQRTIIITFSAAVITAVLTACVLHNDRSQDESISDTPPVSTAAQVPATGVNVGNSTTTESDAASAETSETPLTSSDVTLLAKMVWGEARGCAPEEQRLVVWTVLQRVDAGGVFAQYDTIEAAVTAPGQFVGYDENHPVDTDIYNLCLEVLADWQDGAEPPTHEIYAPTAPYYFFDGDGRHNWFREEW